MTITFTSPEEKWSAVKKVLGGENVAEISRSIGVSRPTIYHWLHVAEQAALAAFARDTPGKPSVASVEEAKYFSEQLQHMLSEYHKITAPSQRVPGPPACPKCRSVRILRNGKVQTKAYGVRQRFWCRRCSLSIYVDLKKTL